MTKRKVGVSFISEIGRRSEMEDAYYFEDLSRDELEIFCAIFDGHGGADAAKHARDYLDDKFFRELRKGSTPEDAFTTAFQEISDELSNQESGTTALAYYLKDKRLYYANVGDCRLVVVTDNDLKQLTRDHRLHVPEERERIISQGGKIMEPYVIRAMRGLMPTRTLGDEYFKAVGVIATPDAGFYKLKPEDKWILVGTDGLFDCLTNDEVSLFLSQYETAEAAAEAIKNEILIERGGSDNLTFILVKVSEYEN